MARVAGWVAWVVTAMICVASSPLGEVDRGKLLLLPQSVPLQRGDIVVKNYRVARTAGVNPSKFPTTVSVEPSRPCLGEPTGRFTCTEAAASGITIDVRMIDGSLKRPVFANCDANAACDELVQVRLRVEAAPDQPVSAEFSLRLDMGSDGFLDSTGLSIVPE